MRQRIITPQNDAPDTSVSRFPIKFNPAWIATFVGCSYILGFIILNAHLGRFRPLEFELLEARYLAAALLFFATTVPSAAIILLVAAISRLPPRGRARTWPGWKLQSVSALLVVMGVVMGYCVWYFTLTTAAIPNDFNMTREGLGHYAWTAFVCVMWAIWLIIRRHDPPREDARHLDPEPIGIGAMMAVLIVSVILNFATNVFPNLEPELGGGGAWVARVVPEPDALPADLAARVSPETIILEANDSDFTLLLCPTTAGDDQMEPVVIARSKFAAVSVVDVVAATQMKKRCADLEVAKPKPQPRQNPAQAARPDSRP